MKNAADGPGGLETNYFFVQHFLASSSVYWVCIRCIVWMCRLDFYVMMMRGVFESVMQCCGGDFSWIVGRGRFFLSWWVELRLVLMMLGVLQEVIRLYLF